MTGFSSIKAQNQVSSRKAYRLLCSIGILLVMILTGQFFCKKSNKWPNSYSQISCTKMFL